ncbi:MAG: PQQ-binding-like beta-propeller repeat protein [bacterium]
MHKSIRSLAQISITFLLFIACNADTEFGIYDWSRFRGPNGSGLAEATGLPVEFGPEKNVVWKTALPAGHSSPILSEDRIFLTAVEGQSLYTICLDRKSGKELWRKEAPRDRQEKLDPRNNPAAPSPAVDDKNVYVFFGDYGLISYDLEGHERWKAPQGPFNNIYGMGASPVLVKDNVVLVYDQSTDSHIIAFNKSDGSVAWKTDRPEAKSGHCTPILRTAENGSTEIIVPGSFFLTAYDADTGEKVWWVRGLSFEMKSTPVMENDVVYINGYGSPLNDPGNEVDIPSFQDILAQQDANNDGYITKDEFPKFTHAFWFDVADLNVDGKIDANEWNYYQAAVASKNGMLAIKAGGKGDMTDTAINWTYHKTIPQLPSPLLYKGILYMVDDGGRATSFKAETGEVIAQKRVQDTRDAYYASPVAADDKIIFISRSGKVVVTKPDGSFKALAVNTLDDQVYATPAIANNRIYIRTKSALYCFGQ